MKPGRALGIAVCVLVTQAAWAGVHPYPFAGSDEALSTPIMFLSPLALTASADGVVCATAPDGPGLWAASFPHPQVRGPTVWGGAILLGDIGASRDGRQVYQARGHTLEVKIGSDVAIVDGRRVGLEGKAEEQFLGLAVIPWNTVATMLGIELRFGRFASRDPAVRRRDWVIRLPRGGRVWPALEVVQRVLARGGYVLLEWTTLDRGGPRCGVVSSLSGALVRSPDGPWADARLLGRELEWQITWNGRNGWIEYGGTSVPVRLRPGRPGSPPKLLVGANGFVIPEALRQTVLGGSLVVPIVPVVRALLGMALDNLGYWPIVWVSR